MHPALVLIPTLLVRKASYAIAAAKLSLLFRHMHPLMIEKTTFDHRLIRTLFATVVNLLLAVRVKTINMRAHVLLLCKPPITLRARVPFTRCVRFLVHFKCRQGEKSRRWIAQFAQIFGIRLTAGYVFVLDVRSKMFFVSIPLRAVVALKIFLLVARKVQTQVFQGAKIFSTKITNSGLIILANGFFPGFHHGGTSGTRA